jgi:hypothetical protein
MAGRGTQLLAEPATSAGRARQHRTVIATVVTELPSISDTIGLPTALRDISADQAFWR